MAITDIKIDEVYAPLFELNSEWRHIAIHGGRGSGKSHGAAQAAIFLSNDHRENIVYGRQFATTFKKSVKALLTEKIDEMHLNSNFSITEDEIKNVNTGSVFSYIGLDRSPNSVRSFEGATLTIMEESQDVKQASIDVLVPTVFRRKNSRMWWLWNPIDKTTPVDATFRGAEPPPRSLVISTSWRNNPYFFDLGMDEQARHLKRINPAKYRHVWEGDYFGGGEDRIFPNVSVEYRDIPETIKPQYGLDFGMQKDPNAFVKIYVNVRERWIYIAREWFGGCATEDLADALAAEDGIPECRSGVIVADSAWPGAIATMKRMGFNVTGAKKGPGSVLDGINWLQGFDIYVSPDCPKIAEEFRLYSWQKSRTGEILKVPEDVYNHGIDAVRYATEENRISAGVRRFARVG